jgi:hypothetical protein
MEVYLNSEMEMVYGAQAAQNTGIGKKLLVLHQQAAELPFCPILENMRQQVLRPTSTGEKPKLFASCAP